MPSTVNRPPSTVMPTVLSTVRLPPSMHPQSCPQSCPQSVFHRPCIRTIRILPAQCRSCMATSGSPFSDVRSRVVYSRSRAVSSTALPWQYRRRALYLDGRVRDPLHSGSRIFLMLFFFEMNAGARSSHKASPHVYIACRHMRFGRVRDRCMLACAQALVVKCNIHTRTRTHAHVYAHACSICATHTNTCISVRAHAHMHMKKE